MRGTHTNIKIVGKGTKLKYFPEHSFTLLCNVIPLNKLSHPWCLLSKYWSRRDISPDGSGTNWGLRLQTERTSMDKLRCFSNSSLRLSDKKGRTDALLLFPSTVSLSLNSPARGGRGESRSYERWWQDAATRGVSLSSHTRIYPACTAGDQLALQKGRKGAGDGEIVFQCPLIMGKDWMGKQARMGFVSKCIQIVSKCKVVVRTLRRSPSTS